MSQSTEPQCFKIRNKSVIKLSEKCPNLHGLILGGCSKITNESIIGLANKCPNLRILDISRGCKITDASIIKLSEKSCPVVKMLEILRM